MVELKLNELADDQLAHLIVAWARATCEIAEFPLHVDAVAPAKQPIRRIGYETWSVRADLLDEPAEFVLTLRSGLRYKISCELMGE